MENVPYFSQCRVITDDIGKLLVLIQMMILKEQTLWKFHLVPSCSNCSCVNTIYFYFILMENRVQPPHIWSYYHMNYITTRATWVGLPIWVKLKKTIVTVKQSGTLHFEIWIYFTWRYQNKIFDYFTIQANHSGKIIFYKNKWLIIDEKQCYVLISPNPIHHILSLSD